MKIRINSKLKKAASFDPTQKSYNMPIHEMCTRVAENELTLPLYQRDMSWTLKKATELLDYQLFGNAPVSPLSINEINNGDFVPQVSFINRSLIENDSVKNGHMSVVDGQQRITTNFKAFINHPDFVNIVLDVSSANFKIIETSPTKSQIPVGVLLNQSSQVLEDYLTEKGLIIELYSLLVNIRSKMHNYSYTINVASNLTEKQQIEWFEILNNAGSRVTKIQMAFSKLKLQNIDIYTDYTRPFKEILREYGLIDVVFKAFTTSVSYPIAALNPAYEVIVNNRRHNNNNAPIPSDIKEDLLVKLETDVLKDIIKLSLDSLNLSLEFLSENSLLDKVDRVDYIQYISGYFAFSEHKSLNELPFKEQQELIEWFENINFKNESNKSRRDEFTCLIKKIE